MVDLRLPLLSVHALGQVRIRLCIEVLVIAGGIPEKPTAMCGCMASPDIWVEQLDDRPKLIVRDTIAIACNDDVANTSPRRRKHLKDTQSGMLPPLVLAHPYCGSGRSNTDADLMELEQFGQDLLLTFTLGASAEPEVP
jgi:hypothetical protein